ncbi:DUF4174 domain-containing protein [Methylobacterium sp. WL120]|uniref:DUF4174 domain-containing protein n=1 Tax=Methylobacterium sp. WL120 TaxID=2603887 RepID=UPI0011C7762D|nr:DUF4174 domain-containing protein [Methylobacterium sp. WL120]TXM64711.1 DUF4174 domain-containing protein [Methylobacterium sp. WL120]
MRVGSGLALANAFAAFAGSGAAAQDPLARYRQVSRVLVLSAPDAGDRRLVAQRATIAAARAGLSERDLVVVEAVGGGGDAEAIRRRLGLPADAFHAVLVGKDGGVKITEPEPIAPQRLFSTIDAMPMRRDEMRRQR